MRSIRRRAEEDDADFIALYRDHVAAVYGLARRLTGNDSEAEDVTSETFVVAWRRRDQLARDPRPRRPWLLGVAARQALNNTRSGRRRADLADRVTHSGGTAALAEPDPADAVAARLDDVETIRRTRAALQLLTRSEAEALALCVWSDLSYRDAAVALGVSPASVRTRLARARRKLREATDPDRTPDAEEPMTALTTSRSRP